MKIGFFSHTWFGISTDFGFFLRNWNELKPDDDFLSSVLFKFIVLSPTEPPDTRFSSFDFRKFCKRRDASTAASLSIGVILWLRSWDKPGLGLFVRSFVVIKLLFRLDGERKYCERLSLSSDSFELRRSILGLLPLPFKRGSLGNKLFRGSYVRRRCDGCDTIVESSGKIF